MIVVYSRIKEDAYSTSGHRYVEDNRECITDI